MHVDSMKCMSKHLGVWSAVIKLDPKTDFSKWKVSQLKQLLEDRGVDDRDCLEKKDYVAKVRQLAQAST